MTDNIYQRYELEALLGSENVPYFDVNAIEDELTEIDDRGRRVWREVGTEYMNAVIARYDMTKQAKKFAERSWRGEGFYRMGWSDGGMDWTNDGPEWYESKEDLAVEVAAAKRQETDTHLLWAEYLGCSEESKEV